MGQVFGVQSSASHPIEKVIGLLKDLGKKVDSEGKDEEVTYAKFEKWCADSFKTLEKSISEEKEQIDSLDSKVDAKEEQEKSLTKKIDELTEEIKKHEVSVVKPNLSVKREQNYMKKQTRILKPQ